MSTPSVSTSWRIRLGSNLPYIIGNVALVIVFWLALIYWPAAPTSGLDPSWRMALGYAVQEGWQFGTDIAFTYGPLGYLLVSTNSGDLYSNHVVWQLGMHLLFAVSIWSFGRLFHGWRRAVYFIYFGVFGIAYVDAIHMLIILLWSFALTRDQVVKRRWLALLLSCGLAVLALVKFTNLILAGVAVTAVVGMYAWRRNWTLVALIGVSFYLGFVVAWAALGQAISNLPAYIINSLSISSGYVEAMGVDESPLMFGYGLTAALALAAYLALTLYRAKDFPLALTIAAITAAAVFLNWKHGFVRADGHVLAHFVVALFFVCCSAALLDQKNQPLAGLKSGLLAISGACCVLGIWLNSPGTMLYSPETLNKRVVDNGANLLSREGVIQRLRDQFTVAQRRFALLDSKAAIGNASVDVFGNEQSVAILSGLNYRARPALQGYAAYNERLSKLDLDFMASARGPEFVLQKINGNTIDHRMPSMDDSLATRYLYHHYEFLMQENQFLLWKRTANDAARDARTPLSTSSVRFGWAIGAPDLGDTPLWCELDIHPSLLGRLRAFFYKPPQMELAVTDGGGETTKFRLIRGQASTGFLVYPHFTSNLNVTNFQAGEQGPRITQMSVILPPEHRKYFKRFIDVRFFQLQPFQRSFKKANDRPHEVRFRLFSQAPDNVVSPYPPELMVEGGKEVMLAHPPMSLEFAVGAETRRLIGAFGMVANAYANANTTDGAEFLVEWLDANNATTTLFRRHLQPKDNVEDRGEQQFNIALPPGPGRLILRTTPGPANNIAFDWTYWTDVKFTR
jgi:hypothetical protein